MAEIVREIGAMTGDQLAEKLPIWASDCRRLGSVRWKDALIAKMYMASLNEPTAALAKALMDRHDGLLPTPIAVGGDVNLGPVRIEVAYVDGEEAEAASGAEGSQE